MPSDSVPTTPNDYLELRQRLNDAEIQWCLAGGQAVNLWALHHINEAPAIRPLGPFTSKDIDPLVISLRNTEKCPELRLSGWTNDSAIGGVVSSPTGEHQGEILKFLPGVPDTQWINRLKKIDGWTLPPPDALYASKCWNLLNIPQETRMDGRHIALLNYALAPYFAHAESEEREAMLETFQRLANNGTLTRVADLIGPENISTLTSHVAIPTTPKPYFYVCSDLYEEITKSDADSSNVYQLTPREEEWTTLLVQFHDKSEGENAFIQTHAAAFETYLANIKKQVTPCIRY